MNSLTPRRMCGTLLGAEGVVQEDWFKREIASFLLPSCTLSKCLNRKQQTGDLSFKTEAGHAQRSNADMTLAISGGTSKMVDKTLPLNPQFSHNPSTENRIAAYGIE